MLDEKTQRYGEGDIWGRADPDITYVGNKITLPNEPGPMPIDAAIATLERKKADEETMLDVHEIIDGYPEDALVAMHSAMVEKYGWASPKPKMSFFGPIAPDLLTIKTGPDLGDEVQVAFGQFTLPGVENAIEVKRHRGRNGPCLVIIGTVRKKEAEVVKDLANLTRVKLAERSIYKGQAIRLRADSDGDLDHSTPPEFLQTRYIKPEELILNPGELDQVQASLWAPVQNTEACKRHGIPLNRGVLLEGTYGCGKTMTANVTSKVCVDNGWTYILLDDVRALKDALLFAQRYQPAVVFAEDADRVAETRDQRGNDLLNTIDGVLTKNAQVITVLTTNHVERLNRAMLRPGRLDAVISVRPPESEAVGRLIKLYGRDLVEGETFDRVGEALAGQIPATVREVVERSKLAMIFNNRDRVTEDDLLVAAEGMKGHLELLADEPEQPTIEHQLGDALGQVISKNSGNAGEIQEVLGNFYSQFAEATSANLVAAKSVNSAVQKGAAQTGSKLDDIEEKVEEIHEEVVS